MKIIVTESQLKKIITENENQLDMFKKLCQEKSNELDKIYTKILFENIGDVLSMNLNMKELNNTVEKIEDLVYKNEKQILKMYESGLLQGVGEYFEMELTDISEVVNKKCTNLTLLINKLEEIQNYEVEYNLTDEFKNIGSINI